MVSICFFLSLLVVACHGQWNLPLPSFPPGNAWNLDVSNAPLDPNSGAIMNQLLANGGFGTNPILFGEFFL